MPTLDIKDFKGLNTEVDETRLEDTAVDAAMNVNLDEGKYFKKRTGISKLASAVAWTTPAQIVGRIRKASGADHFLVCTSTTLYGLLTSTPNTQTNLGAFVVQPGVQYNELLFMPRLTTTIVSYDTLAAGAIAGSPAASQLLVFKDRMFTICTSSTTVGESSKLRYSLLYADPTAPNFTGAAAWTVATQFISFGSGDGDKIVAIAVLNDVIFVFKQQSTYALYASSGSPSAWTVKVISTQIGCICRDTVVEINGLLYFESMDGIYRTDGISFEEVSAPVRSNFNNRVIDGSTWLDDSACFWGTKYILFKNDRLASTFTTWVYDIVSDAWTQYAFATGAIQADRCKIFQDKSPASLYFNDRLSKWLYSFGATNVFSDDSAVITASVVSKSYDFDEPFSMKKCNVADILFRAPSTVTPTFSWATDNGTAISATVPAGDDSPAKVSSKKIAGPGYFRSLQFSFNESGTTGPVTFHGISLDVKPKSRNRKNLP